MGKVRKLFSAEDYDIVLACPVCRGTNWEIHLVNDDPEHINVKAIYCLNPDCDFFNENK